jgi:hypothetical protein
MFRVLGVYNFGPGLKNLGLGLPAYYTAPLFFIYVNENSKN